MNITLATGLGFGINEVGMHTLQPIERAAWYIGQGLAWFGFFLMLGLIANALLRPRNNSVNVVSPRK